MLRQKFHHLPTIQYFFLTILEGLILVHRFELLAII